MWNVYNTDLIQETLNENINKMKCHPEAEKRLMQIMTQKGSKNGYTINEFRAVSAALDELNKLYGEDSLEVMNLFELKQTFLMTTEKFMDLPIEKQESSEGHKFLLNLLCCGYMLCDYDCYGDCSATDVDLQFINNALKYLKESFDTLCRQHKIKESNLSDRTKNILLKQGFELLEDLEKYSKEDLLSDDFKFIGQATASEIEKEMNRNGLYLKQGDDYDLEKMQQRTSK